MTRLHRFEHLRLAQAFSDYLTGQKVKNSIEHSEFSYEIVLDDERQLPIAEQALTEFLANPTQSKYLSASWESGNTNSAPEQLSYANTDLFSNFKQHAGILTHSLFIVCCVIYGLIAFGVFNPLNSFLAFYQQQPFDYLQSWRFITPALLHFSLLHIVFNLLWWWQLGGIVEKQHGKQRLLLLFLFSAIASNLAQFFVVGPYFGGLSGVVYALIGYCWLFGQLDKSSRVQLPNGMFVILLGWLVLGFIDILPANLANYAHLVGLLAGLLLALVCHKLKL
ncbi:rhomboid family intramembrane serine protease GlpG [Psychromonas sp. B3M02]|uniref:rhomboid family intramembrane serine protease GlpG n=1 Tax=Psychromonas sp. B3M02 TaxID=2267226 RepID=UPI000DEA0E78|nr:rhomboid family intramembrane serine protease GlpG [Psychromonas sp. B3M02]RBW45104.1 rhomboid family intramembrane serine protease GlpG [Psychromonas sp. B3M02]